MSTSYDALRIAILNKQQVICTYQGLLREVCPHVIGTKRGRTKVLVYQFAGESSKGLPPEGQWRCMFVEDVTNVDTRSGDWHTGKSHTKPQTCVEEIDAEVAY